MPDFICKMKLLLRGHHGQSVEQEFFARRTVRAAVGAPRPAPPEVEKLVVPKRKAIEKTEIKLKRLTPDHYDLQEMQEYFVKTITTSLGVPRYMLHERTGNSSAATTSTGR